MFCRFSGSLYRGGVPRECLRWNTTLLNAKREDDSPFLQGASN
jgi:hypothetical protein